MSTSYSVTPVCDPLSFPFVVCPFVVLAYSFIFSTRISLFIKILQEGTPLTVIIKLEPDSVNVWQSSKLEIKDKLSPYAP